MAILTSCFVSHALTIAPLAAVTVDAIHAINPITDK